MTEAGVAVLGAAVVLGLAAASAALFVSSAGTAILHDELDVFEAGRGEPDTDTAGTTVLDVRASGVLGADDVRAADRALQDAFREHDLPTAARQVVVTVEAPEVEQRVNLIAVDGGLTDLPPTLGDAGGDVAIAPMSAGRLQVAAGDELRVTSPDTGEEVALTVGRLVEDFEREDMPPAWRPVTGLLTAVDDPRIPPPPPALLLDTEQVLAVLDELGHDVDELGVVSGVGVQVAWTSTVDHELTLEQANELVPRLETLRREVADPTSEVGATLAEPGWSPPHLGGDHLDTALERAASAVAALSVPVTVLAWSGQVLALGAVAVAVVVGGRRRWSRARLWAVRGVPVWSLALRWTAPLVLPALLGVALGAGAAEAAVRSWGPSDRLDAAARADALPALAVAAGAALLVALIASAVTARRQGRTGTPHGRMAPIGEAMLVVLAGLAVWQADTGGGPVSLAADGTLRLDPLAVGLPVLIVAAAAAVGTRLLGGALRATSRSRTSRPAGFLATRRLRSFGGVGLALTVLTASGVGVLVLATTLRTSTDATLEETAGLTLGADAVLPLSRSSVSEHPDPDEIPFPSTRVRRAPEATLDGGTVEVLAIDPASFAGVAYAPQYLAELDLAELAARLPTSDTEGPLPAIAVGTTLRDPSTVTIADLEVAVEQVARAPVFPGASAERPTVVIPDGGPLEPDDPATTARLAVAVYPELWVDRTGTDDLTFRTRLAAVDQPAVGSGPGARSPDAFSYAQDLRDDPGVAPATWALVYLHAQAVVVAMLGLLALLGHHVARQRHQALATQLAVRMGLRRPARILIELLETAVVTTAALVLGATSGIVAARAVVNDYDPLPEIGLPVVFTVPWPSLSLPLVVASVAVVVTTWLTVRLLDRTDVSSLLRGGG